MEKQIHEKRRAGFGFYRDSGYEKALLVHISAKTHSRLMRLADKADTSLQATVRKILEKHTQSK